MDITTYTSTYITIWNGQHRVKRGGGTDTSTYITIWNGQYRVKMGGGVRVGGDYFLLINNGTFFFLITNNLRILTHEYQYISLPMSISKLIVICLVKRDRNILMIYPLKPSWSVCVLLILYPIISYRLARLSGIISDNPSFVCFSGYYIRCTCMVLYPMYGRAISLCGVLLVIGY